MTLTRIFPAPLFTSWREQYVRLSIPELKSGQAVALCVDGAPHEFQYTGTESEAGAEIMLRLGFDKGQTKTLAFTSAEASLTDLTRLEMDASEGAAIGVFNLPLRVPELTCKHDWVSGPLAGFAGFALQSRIFCDASFIARQLTRTNSGSLFEEYELSYVFAGGCAYTLKFRCFRDEPIVEVSERFALGMGARAEIVFNPEGACDALLAQVGGDFEGEAQPVIAPLESARPDDLLCRLQMPVLSEYFIPTNKGWFAFFNRREPERGMLGVLGLYGARWTRPAANMPQVFSANGSAVWKASLSEGERHWLLYAGPLETEFTPQKPLVFHRLHAQWNALRLDEHLELGEDRIYDEQCWKQPAFFADDFRERARHNLEALPPLRRFLEAHPDAPLGAVLEKSPDRHRRLRDDLFDRFALWVRQFQGFRRGEFDYAKNVIGFSRRLRGLLLQYELLRRDEYLSDEEVARLHSYFVFAARRILDEGRWPHSRTWLHPDHPESVRDFYTYGGEHKPDRLVWTNSLPNFQSDPMCALAHLSTLIPEHPDAKEWQRFALDDLERQLDAYCSSSGAWEESINYALYTLSYFVITFRALRNRTGINYFEDERMRRFAGWLTRFFGPLDKRFNAYTFPGIGNARVPQNEGHILLAYAGELKDDDPLRADLIACYQKMEPDITPIEHTPLLLAMSPIPDREYSLRPLQSEHMDELGVALRHDHPSPTESYLFQKIGFWKDHYENDETSFNWYAKGTPLVMDYGTYTPDVGSAAAHNLVEIPDMDSLQRGYLADSFFSEALDYTRCEVPVNLKLLHGRLRTFEEIDGPPESPPYFYIGDENPTGPKVWKTRMLLFIKPDYIVLFDRVLGPVPHRFNLHVTADDLMRENNFIHAQGRFDLDLLCYVQHPGEFEWQSGELIPSPEHFGAGKDNPHRQQYFRLYNTDGDVYRTLLFAKERERAVSIEKIGASGMKVTTPEYCDYVFVSDEVVKEKEDGIEFTGRAGWIRREASGTLRAVLIDGDGIAAFGTAFNGRGPWSYNLDGEKHIVAQGTPRIVRVNPTPHSSTRG
jgi:hypothetical protein